MPKFYFTYGRERGYDYLGGWTEIIADNRWTAWNVFTALHPKKDGQWRVANCSGIYTEEQWKTMKQSETNRHLGYGCHERITVERTNKHDCRLRGGDIDVEDEQ